MAGSCLPYKYFTKNNKMKNGEHKGKAGDGQFLKRGMCVKI